MSFYEQFHAAIKGLEAGEASRFFDFAITLAPHKNNIYFQLIRVFELEIYLDIFSKESVLLGSDFGIFLPSDVIHRLTDQAPLMPEVCALYERQFEEEDFFEEDLAEELVGPRPGLTKATNDNWLAYRSWRLGYTPESVAILRDDISTLRSHIAGNEDFNIEQTAPFSPVGSVTLLGLSALFGSIKCMIFLLMNGADPFGGDWTAMQCACCSGSREIVHILLDTDDDTSTLFCLGPACLGHQHEFVEWLFESEHADPNEIDDSGYPALHWAVRGHNYKALFVLLAHGANIDIPNPNDGRSALFRVVEIGELPMVQFLLEHGADPNFKDASGQTPIYLGALVHSFHEPCLEMLLQYGANVNCVDNRGDSPLDFAVIHDCEYMVEFLIEKGAELRSHSIEMVKNPVLRQIIEPFPDEVWAEMSEMLS